MSWLADWFNWLKKNPTRGPARVLLIAIFGPTRFAAFETSLRTFAQLERIPELPGPIDDQIRNLGTEARKLLDFIDGPAPAPPTSPATK